MNTLKELDMVKKMNESVQQHQQKTADLIRKAAAIGVLKTSRDSSGRLIITK